MQGNISVDSFCEAIRKAHVRNGCDTLGSLQTFQQHFGKALEEYMIVLLHMNDMAALGVVGYEAGPFLVCAACSGAGEQVNASTDSYAAQVARRLNTLTVPCHSVYVDGVFSLKHIARQGKRANAVRRSYVQKLMAPDLQPKADDDAPGWVGNRSLLSMQAYLARPGNNIGAVHERVCASFKAGTSKSRPDDKYDISGVFGLFCRHGILGLAVNIKKGESYTYARFLMDHLLATHKTPVLFLIYDIGKQSRALGGFDTIHHTHFLSHATMMICGSYLHHCVQLASIDTFYNT